MFDTSSLNTVLRLDLVAFIRKVFATVAPGDGYVHNWHIEAIAYELARVKAGESNRLIINQPPRSLKSIVASVAFPAWLIGHDPTMKVICVSYGSELAGSLHRQFRMVVDADWYKAIFPQMAVDKDTGSELVTTQNGGRFATSVGGTLTGRGARLIIIDDPLKADDAASESARRKVTEWYSSTLVSRLDEKAKGAIVVVMQRLHEDDLSGHLLAQPGWRHLNLPAIATADEVISIGPKRTFARKDGTALQPGRENLVTLAQLKSELGSISFSAQYQQAPVPPEGNIVKLEWFKFYDQPPDREPGDQMIHSWDIAMTTTGSSNYSACTMWLKRRSTYFLLQALRTKLEFPDLKKKVIQLAQVNQIDVLLLEDAGLGIPLIQQLRHEQPIGVPLPVGMKPQGEKAQRMEAGCAKIESGQVYLPKDAAWLGDFLNEVLAFPTGKFDDQVDSLSQFLTWAGSTYADLPGTGLPEIYDLSRSGRIDGGHV